MKRLVKKFGIGKSTVGDVLGEKEKWLAITESSIDANKKRSRGGDWPQLEEALAIWVNLANEANHTITGAILSQKATQFAQRLNISNFKSSQEKMYEEEMYEEPNELENELESEENAVQLLISQMNIDIMANNYINIDDRIEIAEFILVAPMDYPGQIHVQRAVSASFNSTNTHQLSPLLQHIVPMRN
ncbi:3564_t:CDS:2 [Entrophospora sp. SA101]|nr:3564_t:CDS:2 [Entrophospora sp. SA101]